MASFKPVSIEVTDKRKVVIEGQEIGAYAFTIGAIQVDDTGKPAGDGRVDIEVRYQGGRYIAKAVKVSTDPGSDTPVTADLLRAVSIEDLLREGVGHEMRHYQGLIGHKPDTSQGPTDENLRVVAIVYRRAYALGDPPTKAVAQSLGLNPNTAARWVMKARERGFLAPTEKGKAGA